MAQYWLFISADVMTSGHTAKLGTIFVRDHLLGILKQEGNVAVSFAAFNGGINVMIATGWNSRRNRSVFRQSLSFRELVSKTKHLLVQGKYEIELQMEE